MITSLLNRASMYRLLSITLTCLWVVAFIFSLFGVISYSPLALIASIGVLGVVVFLASELFGHLFGVRVHSESSYITAFILFFIFTPTLEVGSLVVLGFVALLAAASKFLLVWRGRHIFNPAAIAAFIIGLTGLGFASWWVATPPLFPFTVLLGLLIIQKTRQFLLSGLFLGITIPLIFFTELGYGASAADALALMLSWPLFYFSMFMLTEPQTLPPKKWQQMVEVVVVALLFALPFHIGSFTSNPAFALVVGNLIAFIFSRRQAITLQYKGSRQLAATSREFTFMPTKKVTFEPGQYIEITIPHKNKDGRGVRRSFSITSASTSDDIKLGVKFYQPSSSFKKELEALSVGSYISATSVNGSFTLPKDKERPLLFIAGGIGITPFISHLRSLRRLGERRDIILVYSLSSLSDFAYRDVIEAAGVNVFVVTQFEGESHSGNWKLINEPRITVDTLRKCIPDIAMRHVYVSGPPAMIDSVKRSLRKLGVRRIKTDYFVGY